MLEATMEFEPTALRRVLEAFFALPDALRPTHHSDDEEGHGNPIGDRQLFIDATSVRRSGFFLKGPGILHDVIVTGSTPIICNSFLNARPELAKRFLVNMANAQPIFGFSCAEEEREARNRLKTKVGVNTIESWVGRDPRRYVPGLYWLTLLSDSLVKKHGVSLPALEEAALEHVELEGGQHLFRFYEQPTDWTTTQKVASLCSTLPGFFDIERVKPEVAAAKNLQELWAVLDRWP